MIIKSLFDAYQIIIWCLSNHYLMIIEWLFDVYLMFIWWWLKLRKVATGFCEPDHKHSQTGGQVWVTLRGPESKILFVANHPLFSINNPSLMILSLSVRLSANTPDNQRIMNGYSVIADNHVSIFLEEKILTICCQSSIIGRLLVVIRKGSGRSF